jgi:hypothetical protein
MHAKLTSEVLRSIALDPQLDEVALKILLWMLSHPGEPKFGIKRILEISHYQRLSGVRGAMDLLRQAQYVSLVGEDAEGLELYQASPKPCFDDFGMYSGKHSEGER